MRTGCRQVAEEIEKGNPWYVGDQFEWAEKPSIQPIYEKRFRYFLGCIERARRRLGAELRFLDAGCGDGYWLSRLAGLRGLSLSGVDYNPVRVERAKRVAAGANVRCSDLSSFAPGELFDVMLLSQVIEHVQDDVGLLRKAHSLLRPGGVLILGSPNEGSQRRQRIARRRGLSPDYDHLHFYTESELREKARGAGFRTDSAMREVFYIGSDRWHYSLTKRRWGFVLLELMTRVWPEECSGLYFECCVAGRRDQNVGP